MKRFLLFGLIALVIALVSTVAVFWYVQYQLQLNDEARQVLSEQPAVDASSSAAAVTSADASTELRASPEEGIPLKSLPVNETQEKVLDAVGVDTETFIITPTMIDCAQKKLGMSRYNEIIAGAAPTILEGMSLLQCNE